jgi:hypothetical protein
MNQKDKVEQARADMLKTIRTAVRLRHALVADNELNYVLPAAERVFNARVQLGELPDPLTMLEAYEAGELV